MDNDKKKRLIKLERTRASSVGLLQAIGVVIYCGLVSALFWFMEEISIKPPRILTATFMLFLLVFSAAITGLLVFGYPVYLGLNKEIKRALLILGYTFLYSVAIILIILLLILS